MTFSQVLNMIRNTANAVNKTGTFIHGRNSDAANNPDLPYPRIHLYPFIQERDPNDDHRRTANLLLSFVEADSGDQDMTERETIISNMDTLVDSFVDQLKTDYENDVEFSQIRTEPQYQILEGVSGYTLQLNIRTQVEC
jgi:hypothetical protein